MKKLLIAAAAIAAVAAPISLAAAPANADTGSPKCMTLSEWRKIKTNNTMSRPQVKRIVGYDGRKGRVSHYSDGTIDFYVDYRLCGKDKRPHPYLTTFLAFETEVTYGDYVWDDYATFVEGHCVGGYDYSGDWDSCWDYSDSYWEGGYVWDEYAENGVTSTPKVRYKGSF